MSYTKEATWITKHKKGTHIQFIVGKQIKQNCKYRTSECSFVITIKGKCHMTPLPRYVDTRTDVFTSKNEELTDEEFFFTKIVRSWNLAAEACRREGANLASLWSKDLVDAIKMMSQNQQIHLHSAEYIAIGLKRQVI